MLGKKSFVFATALGLGFSLTATAYAAETTPQGPAPAQADAPAPSAPAPEAPPAAPAPEVPPPPPPPAPDAGTAPAAPAPAPAQPAPGGATPPAGGAPVAPPAAPPSASFAEPDVPPAAPSSPAAPPPGGSGFVPSAPAQPAYGAPAPAPAPTPVPATIAPAPNEFAEPATPPASNTTPGEDEASRKEEEDEDGPMGWAGIGFEIGYQHFSDASFDTGGDPATEAIIGGIPERNNRTLALTLDLGGDGLGLQLSPYYATGEIRNTDLTTIGVFVGGMLRPRFGSVYPHVGVGLQAGYMSADIITYGLDLYARVPIGITFYPVSNLALVAELGLGWGMTGVQYPTQELEVDTGQGISVTATSPDLEFGTTTLYDLSIGLRFP